MRNILLAVGFTIVISYRLADCKHLKARAAFKDPCAPCRACVHTSGSEYEVLHE